MADGEIDYLQDFDRERNLIFPYTEQVVNHPMSESVSQVGDALTEIVRIDGGAVRIRVYDLSALHTLIDDPAQFDAIQGAVSFNVPPTLLSLTTSFNENKGDGQSHFGGAGNGAYSSVGTSVNAVQQPRASASASAATMVDVFSVIRPNIADDVPCTSYYFYRRGISTANQLRGKVTTLAVTGASFTVTIATPGVFTCNTHGFVVNDEVVLFTTGALPTGLTSTTVIYFIKTVPTGNTFTLSLTAGGAAINTTGTQSGLHTVFRAVKTWPHWKPEQVQILCKSQEASVQQSAEANATVNVDPNNASIAWWKGDSDAESNGVTIKNITIPPTLHAALTIASPTTTSVIAVTVLAETDDVIVDGTNWLTPRVSAPTSKSKNVVATVTPTTFTATVGFTDVPTSGFYMRPPEGTLDIFDLTLYRITVVDFSYFA